MKFRPYYMVIILLSACHSGWRHPNSEAYQRLPDLTLLATDSSHIIRLHQLPADRPTILFYFDPDCEHCQLMTSYLVAYRKHLSNINMLFVSPAAGQTLKQFEQKFYVDSIPHVLVASDYRYELFNTFKTDQLPILIIYDQHQALSKMYKGEVEMSRVIKALRS